MNEPDLSGVVVDLARRCKRQRAYGHAEHPKASASNLVMIKASFLSAEEREALVRAFRAAGHTECWAWDYRI